ncbi:MULTISPECIES: hypothetical protein [Curtobacterium]|uniref:hypothetical protein n=1 Tax=Curtobacterium TaxID=2034 RepID=UPI000FFF65E2|nr:MULTISPECIES: hypothetical protein [Curtobacterium]MBO9043262.1 hypothetical protein [Curtobacterium flaccumfaciens pv. flaccumfaciens]MBO9048327.1 hypothetical protein [Curtobacterium flaccumfaciens pv. flaccumfaciens]MBO9051541.1 hypothetical protein [Curtobacterium flaccumfaciens pv. flaccumfaciens]MBO9057217.1 hypothetical protein [Curtobacterium flaccumfaciens pv. flaccumfaciens]MBT1672372.1 hypothetical protein [Curtobacterium flaccumfaciens pv. flaccumfaciens]
MTTPKPQGSADLVGLLVGAPLALIGIVLLVSAGSTPTAVLGAAVLVSGTMLVCTALLIRGLRRER